MIGGHGNGFVGLPALNSRLAWVHIIAVPGAVHIMQFSVIDKKSKVRYSANCNQLERQSVKIVFFLALRFVVHSSAWLSAGNGIAKRRVVRRGVHLLFLI